MRIRAYQPADCRALTELFYETVHTVTVRDYTAAQRDAWATGQVDLAAWDASLQAHVSLVVEEDGVLIGFADLDAATGYLDRLYVHKDYQRQGIATALCDALEQATAADTLTTHASITARPFFEQRGYRVVREQQVERRGVWLTNYVMEKKRRSENET